MKKFLALLALFASLSSFASSSSYETAVVTDQLDAGVFDAFVTQINGSAGALVPVVASLSGSAGLCRVSDTTGSYIGLYQGSTLKFIITPGLDAVVRCELAAGSVINVRAMETPAITIGKLVIQFMR